jgi:hypothetical protein
MHEMLKLNSKNTLTNISIPYHISINDEYHFYPHKVIKDNELWFHGKKYAKEKMIF